MFIAGAFFLWIGFQGLLLQHLHHFLLQAGGEPRQRCVAEPEEHVIGTRCAASAVPQRGPPVIDAIRAGRIAWSDVERETASPVSKGKFGSRSIGAPAMI